MIPNIPNRYARRTLLVLTVAGIVVCLGPLHIGRAVWAWVGKVMRLVEWEFETDLRAIWNGGPYDGK